MKRQNLMIDDQLLQEATLTLGKKTFSETVNHALREALRVQKASELLRFEGTGIWEGDLENMRGKAPKRKPSRK